MLLGVGFLEHPKKVHGRQIRRPALSTYFPDNLTRWEFVFLQVVRMLLPALLFASPKTFCSWFFVCDLFSSTHSTLVVYNVWHGCWFNHTHYSMCSVGLFYFVTLVFMSWDFKKDFSDWYFFFFSVFFILSFWNSIIINLYTRNNIPIYLNFYAHLISFSFFNFIIHIKAPYFMEVLILS